MKDGTAGKVRSGLHISLDSRIRIVYFLLFFFVGGLLRSRFVTVPFIQAGGLIYSVICLAWAQSLRQRVLNRRIRNLLVGIAWGMLAMFTAGCCRYIVFDELPDVRRFTWYLESICFTGLSFLSFVTAVQVGRRQPAVRILKGPEWLLLPPAVVLALLILTNDLHELVYFFPYGPSGWIREYGYGYVHYIHVAWILLLSLFSLFLMLKNCRRSICRRYAWAYIIPFGLSGIYFTVFFLNRGGSSAFLWPHFFNPTEVFCFVMVTFWESSIQIGLIPSCTGYDVIFDRSPLQAFLTRRDGSVTLKSRAARPFPPELLRSAAEEDVRADDDTILKSRPINGGRVYWTDDIADINALGEKLRQSLSRLSEEETLLSEQNRLKELKVRYATQTRVFDDISRSTEPQMKEIQQILDSPADTEQKFREQLKRIAVYGAYVKRRANLMLLSGREKLLPPEELFLCVRESLDMLSLSGVRTRAGLGTSGAASGPAAVTGLNGVGFAALLRAEGLMEVYDAFEEALEQSYGKVGEAEADLYAEGGSLVLKLILRPAAGLSGQEAEYLFRTAFFSGEGGAV